MSVPVYQRPVAGQAVSQHVQRDAKSPRIKVKFANVAKPFFYQSSNNVARYSVTGVLDPDIHLEFIQKVIALEAKEGITDSQTLKHEIQKGPDGNVITTGRHLMKFQTKEKIPVIVCKAGFPQVPAELKEEIRVGDEVIVVFDVLRYTKKNPQGPSGKGISYQPKMIYLYPNEEVPKTQNSGDYDDHSPF